LGSFVDRMGAAGKPPPVVLIAVAYKLPGLERIRSYGRECRFILKHPTRHPLDRQHVSSGDRAEAWWQRTLAGRCTC
jgi:hypothetical protein